MEVNAIISGFAEFLLALVLAPCIIYAALRAFSALTRDLDEMEALREDNTAVGILLASTLIATALVMKQALGPVITNLDTVLYTGAPLTEALKMAGFGLAYVVTATVLAIAGIGIATRVFLRLTRGIDELQAISAGNNAVAITLGAAIIVTGMLLADGTASLLAALVPYPAVGVVQVMGVGG